MLALMAWNVKPGDAIFCPSFSFTATAEVIPWLGATPVFVDILQDTYNIDPDKLEMAIETIKRNGELTPKAIIAVDLFGQPADYPRIAEIARKHNMKLIADSAQGFGCTLNSRHPIEWADAVTISFFPAKPLGCYGDGGAIQTNDAQMSEVLDSLRVHGKATQDDIAKIGFTYDPKYLNVRIGMNSRLDTIQAAILLAKLEIYPDEITKRNAIAIRYNEGLSGVVLSTPSVIEGGISNWAQYTIEVEDRTGLSAHLNAKGIPTAAYYPIPIHKQSVYSHFPIGEGGLPVTEQKSNHVISLPMHPYLDKATQDLIIQTIQAYH